VSHENDRPGLIILSKCTHLGSLKASHLFRSSSDGHQAVHQADRTCKEPLRRPPESDEGVIIEGKDAGSRDLARQEVSQPERFCFGMGPGFDNTTSKTGYGDYAEKEGIIAETDSHLCGT